MKLWKVQCWGRRKGALGICYPITDYVHASHADEVELAVYQKYEHIAGLHTIEVNNEKDEQKRVESV